MRHYWVCMVALIALLACAVPGRAQVFVRAPFVRVAVGPPALPLGPVGVNVQTPFVSVNVGGPGPVFIGRPVCCSPVRAVIVAPPPPPVIVAPPVLVAPYTAATPTPVPETVTIPPAPPVPPPEASQTALPSAPQPVPNRALTVDEFARTFQPTAGRYQVALLHPRTNSPVNVAFTLPEGTPRVRLSNRELAFDYGRQEVDIRFLLGGRVEVSYRD